jgi:polysaccharide export outer membrane protein
MSAKQIIRAALLLGALAGTTACGFTARSGPTASALLSPGGEAGYEVVEITPATLASVAPPMRAQAVSMAAPGQAGYRIMPGDVLNVTIFERSDGGLFAPASAGGTQFQNVRVEEGGTITLPYAGQVRVAGSTLARAGQAIGGALAGTAVDPRIHVQLVSSAAHSVLVSGDVRTPGRISLLDGPLTAMDAIARAGGPSQAANAADVVIHSRNGTRRLSYLDLMGQPNLPIAMGDQIIVEPNERRFLVMGAVRRPGLQPMTSPRMSMLDGLGAAGGLVDQQAAPYGVFLLRASEAASGVPPRLYRLDMSRGESLLLAHRFPLRPDDVLYVTNAPIWEVQKFFAPILDAARIGVIGAALSQ